jgi:transmembrane 9 superfamily protein 2/4
MLENKTCAHLCTSLVAPKAAIFLYERLKEGMSQNWLVDGLPAAEMKQDEQTKELFYSAGFPLGRTLSSPDDPKPRLAINNHFDIYLEHHSPDGGLHQRVVGAVVWPRR